MGWLRARGLTYNSRDNAQAFKDLVKKHMEAVSVPQILPETSVEATNVQQFLNSGYRMASLVMSRSVDRVYIKKLELLNG